VKDLVYLVAPRCEHRKISLSYIPHIKRLFPVCHHNVCCEGCERPFRLRMIPRCEGVHFFSVHCYCRSKITGAI